MATKKTSKNSLVLKKKPRLKARRAKPMVRTKAKAKTVKKSMLKAKKAPAQKRAHKEKMNKLWCERLMGDARVRKWLVRNVGEHSIHVIQEFSTEMSDEEIARKANVRASDVRVVLNRLHSYGLAAYYRSRDKNSGWYSYVWRLNNEKAAELMAREVGVEVAAPESAVVSDGATGAEMYACTQCAPVQKIPFEEASGLMFRCAQCGSSLSYVEKKS